jgi:predicted DNA-binding protein YlxM (UPF0122 family)
MKPLSEKQIEVAIALFEGRSIPEIASEFSISKATIHRWQGLDEFKKFRRSLSENATKSKIERIARLRDRAIERLESIIDDNDQPAKTQLSAIRLILDHFQEDEVGRLFVYLAQHKLAPREKLVRTMLALEQGQESLISAFNAMFED